MTSQGATYNIIHSLKSYKPGGAQAEWLEPPGRGEGAWSTSQDRKEVSQVADKQVRLKGGPSQRVQHNHTVKWYYELHKTGHEYSYVLNIRQSTVYLPAFPDVPPFLPPSLPLK